MQKRYRRVLLAMIVLLCAVGGLAGRALALTFSEFPIPTGASSPITITPGPDGALWFTEALSNKIGRITPAGAITEFPLPTANPRNYVVRTNRADLPRRRLVQQKTTAHPLPAPPVTQPPTDDACQSHP